VAASTARKPSRDLRAPYSLIRPWIGVFVSLHVGQMVILAEPHSSAQQKQCPHGTSAWSATWEDRYKATWKSGIQTFMAQGRSTTIISMIQWTRTSSLSIKISLSHDPPPDSRGRDTTNCFLSSNLTPHTSASRRDRNQ